MPIIPFGAGTSLEGHVAALYGGVCVDLSRLDRILRIDVADLDCTVEAGVTRLALDARLRPEGVFFPVDPGADATLGGMASTGASGTTTVRYGSMRHNVLGLTAVAGDGRVLRLGSRARKSSAGLDLTRLFVGAEGTLGIVTDVTLRVHPVPEAIAAAVCQFPDVASAVAAVIEVILSGIGVARIELLDELTMEAVERRYALEHAPLPTLFLEFHGSPVEVEDQAARTAAITGPHGGSAFAWSTREEDRRLLWTARHHSYEATLALRPGAKGLSTDVCVPISRLAESIEDARADLVASRLLGPIVGHVGDGNFHVLVLLDPDDPDEAERVRGFNDRLVRRALRVGGTCTGEHGIGSGKGRYLAEEQGPEAVAAQLAVKRALDPLGIMNPGKNVDAAVP